MTLALPIWTAVEADLPSNDFDNRVRDEVGTDLDGLTLETVQVNIGLRCNLACHHCHVESSPTRKEQMTWETMAMVLDAARRAGAKTLDITGGAPEMHPLFGGFVDAAIAQGLHVLVRTNLTIMLQAGYVHLPRFYAERGVHLVASLPCYLETNVDKQRGKHVYRDSIEVIRQLNALGYGNDPRLQLDLVYNPGGPSLPPPQQKLEEAYRVELFNRFDIRFNRLYTITNMPIGRFLHDLRRDGQAERYGQVLRDAFNPATLPELMCRHQLHVGWDGQLYDCDFNYGIGLPVNGPVRHIRDFDPGEYRRRRIATGSHCFGCTAGCGSSCKGSLASE
jgi:radical SAM/Cys-rich protein